VTLAVFMSGAAGLIFQIAWLYECGLVFGNSLWAASIVLSSLMGGLALGNALVVRFERRVRFPLAAYAALEAIVALAGVALTYTLPNLTALVAPLTGAVAQHAWIVILIRLAVAFAVLVVPATAMGATLPIVVGALARGRTRLGGVLGHLYGWNTLGAVVGVVGAEVVLINRFGIRGSGLVAAALDLSAAGIALWCSPRIEAAAMDPARKTAQPASPIQRRALASAFLAGGALLGLELVWFRFLMMYVLSTTLAVSLMLASVLAAIAAGGLVASLWLRRRPESAIPLAPLALALGSVTVLSYIAFQWLTAGTQIAEWYRVLWLAAALTAPTAFVSGAFFTALGDAMASGKPVAPMSTTAWLTLANTAGAMCGPLVAVFVLLPVFGIEGALFALALVYGAIALIAPRTRASAAPWRSPSVVVTALVFALLFVTFPFGLMSSRYFVRSAQAYADDGSTIVATREGSADTILLMRQQWLGKPVYDRMITNGFSMSGTAVPAMRYMRYFAYWPMLMHQAPLKKALVVCYGVGVTAGAVTDIASLESIDVAEISPDVVAMSDVIYANARSPLHDPRVRLHLEDGRNFLQTTGERFDLITGEPPPPRTPGAVNIYTREYFTLLYDRLAEGGIATYWVPVARPDPGTDVDTIIRAFCDVFDDCSLWNGTPFDLMLAGSRHATTGTVQLVQDEASFSKPWVTPGLESRLREVGFETPQEIGATFIGDAPYLRALTAHTPPLVDDFPQRLIPVPGRPSLSDPRYRSDPAVADYFQKVIDPTAARERLANSSFARRLLPDALIAETLRAFEDQRIVNRVLWEGGKPLRQIEDLHFLLTHTTLRALPLWVLGSDDVKQRIAETSADRTGVVEYARALRALSGRDYAGAAALLAAAEQRGFHGTAISALRAYALCRIGQIDAARDIARGIQAADPDERHFWGWMGTTFGVEIR
jgi:spermidine synthase